MASSVLQFKSTWVLKRTMETQLKPPYIIFQPKRHHLFPGHSTFWRENNCFILTKDIHAASNKILTSKSSNCSITSSSKVFPVRNKHICHKCHLNIGTQRLGGGMERKNILGLFTFFSW